MTYQSYKFAAATYKANGYRTNEYIEQAICTYRGIVSCDDVGDTLAHMAIRFGDMALLDRMMAKFSPIMFVLNEANVRPIDVDRSKLSHIVHNIVSMAQPQRLTAIRKLLYYYSPEYADIIDKSITDYILARGTTQTSTQSLTNDEAICVKFLDICYAAKTGIGMEYATSIVNSTSGRSVASLLPDYMSPSAISELIIQKKYRCRSGNKHDKASRIISRSVAAFVLDDTPSVLDNTPSVLDNTPSVLDDTPNVRIDAPTVHIDENNPDYIWILIAQHKWADVLSILCSSCDVTRVLNGKSIIYIISKEYPRCREQMSVFSNVLRRWPELTANELSCWFYHNSYHICGLVQRLAPRQPQLTHVFSRIEQGICERIIGYGWSDAVSFRKRLDILMQLKAANSMHEGGQ